MLATIIIATAIFVLMAYIIIHHIKKIKKGEGTCGCGCTGCSSKEKCHSPKN